MTSNSDNSKNNRDDFSKKNKRPRIHKASGNPNPSSDNKVTFTRPEAESPPFRPYDKESSGNRNFNRDNQGERNFNRDNQGERNAGQKPGFQRPFNKKFSGGPNKSGFKKPNKPKHGPVKDYFDPNEPVPERPVYSEKENTDEEIRLNKYIANSGVCSRRKADEIISKGQVTVNGVPVDTLGYKVKRGDRVEVDGKKLSREQFVYVLLNKPKDFLTTTEDPQERRTVMDLVKRASTERIYPVGRLDRNTTGLLLLTNDGEISQKLAHPKHSVEKLYQVTLDKNLTRADYLKIQEGVVLEDGLVKVDEIAYLDGKEQNEIGLLIHVGKNRIVRRIFESLGYEVAKLDRVIYAGLTKKDLPRGKWRYLSDEEVRRLKYFTK